MNKNYVGILGDPAKINEYPSEFYNILNWDETFSSFHLIGASENNIGRHDYHSMFSKIKKELNGTNFPKISGLSGSTSNFSSRVGLFPSSARHLIRGPSFSFAPFPVNSTSKYLKIKSKLLTFFLSPILPFKIRTLAYVPLGGKAASKTNANESMDLNFLPSLFYNLRNKNRFDWYYLEAGSGEAALDSKLIYQVLEAQAKSIMNLSDTADLSNYLDGISSRLIVPRTIYGGGIRSISQLKTIFETKINGLNLVPECVIIGNISEEDVSVTYKIVELIGKYNEISSLIIDNSLV